MKRALRMNSRVAIYHISMGEVRSAVGTLRALRLIHCLPRQIHAANGRLEKALASFRTATELDSNDVKAWFNLSRVLANLGACEPARAPAMVNAASSWLTGALRANRALRACAARGAAGDAAPAWRVGGGAPAGPGLPQMSRPAAYASTHSRRCRSL